MADSQSVRARRMRHKHRAALIQLMGGECVLCHTTEDLEFDHPHGRDWGDPKHVGSTARIKRYEKEYAEGKLRLLCSDCNKRTPPDREDVPF